MKMRLPINRLITVCLIYISLSSGSDDYRDYNEERIVTSEEDILGLDLFLSMGEEARENALDSDTYRWPNATVFYKLSESFSCEEKCIIHEAMLEMEKRTCLNFIKSRHHDDYLHIMKKDICASYVGRQHGSQELYLSSSCAMNVGNVMHELMHAIGFFHEHSRLDRDDFITINWENIERRDFKHFENHNLGNVTTYNMHYDYGSLMHYGPLYFSKNDQITIKTKHERDQTIIGQRLRLSESDIKRINLHYKCDPKHSGCIDKEVTCKNTGTLEFLCSKQRVAREKLCRKTCGRCKVKLAVCPLCDNHYSRCQKWTDTDDCPKIEVDVRKHYFRNCEKC